MLPKKYRFNPRLNPDFFSTSQRFFTPGLTFFYQPQLNPLAKSQWAIIIPKKAARLSTQRHTLKRQLGTQILPLTAEFPPFQIAVTATPRINQFNSEQLRQQLQKFLSHLSTSDYSTSAQPML